MWKTWVWKKTRVQVDKTHIVSDAQCRTAEPGVYAIGDVAGPPWLAHKASHEGVLCVEHIAGLSSHALDPRRVPACTYSHPQVASMGWTEAQAKAAGRAVKVGKFPLFRKRQGDCYGLHDRLCQSGV
jgi:dihydrolipoamide dehydrogenase